MNQEIIRFDAEGDVILATNLSSYLLVSSKCLAQASPVFKQLLEGVPPASTAGTQIIQVGEYHATSLQFACGVIHGKDPSPWQPRSPLQLFHLAVACHYELECATRTNWLIRIIFESFAFEVSSMEDIVDLLATAMVCKFDYAFKRLSKLLVYEAVGDLTQLLTRETGLHIGKPRLGENESHS